MEDISTTTRAAWSVAEFCARYCVSKTTAFRLIKDGELGSVLVRSKRLIPVESADTWWARQQKKAS